MATRPDRRRRRAGRWSAALRPLLGRVPVLAVLLVVVTAAPAGADPAGPTDYRTEVTEVDPPVEGVEVAIIGGDSFIQVRVDAGMEVEVVGYQGEPYLRFEADGTVVRNERSPARWLNDDRFGESAVPDDADPEAEPVWEPVADGGSYAWHDHRTHWMNAARPPGAVPGDTVLEAVVPLIIDGETVRIHVRSTLLAGPSPALPAGVGLLAALALAASHLRSGRRVLAPVSTAAAVAALGIGAWAFLSVPSETGPSLLLWALPGAAVVASVGARVLGRRPGTGPVAAALLVAFAGFELLLWAVIRREALVRAVIPSEAPAQLDRAVIAAAAAVGLVALLGGLADLVGPLRNPTAASAGDPPAPET